MPYQYTEFDGVPLPIYNPSQDHSSTQVGSSLVRSAGGLFDRGRSGRRSGQGLQINMTGLFVGRPADYLLGAPGVNLVTETGALFITGSEAADLRVRIDQLRAKVGSQGRLIRSWLPDGDNRQYVTARLLRVGWPQEVTDRLWKAELTCQFESVHTQWHSETLSASAINVINGSQDMSIFNEGTATVEDATLTIAATSTITSIQVRNTTIGVNWVWLGTLLAGESLVINDDAQTVRRDGIDAYSGMIFNPSHTVQAWLPIAPGINTYTVIANNTGIATMDYRNQWL